MSKQITAMAIKAQAGDEEALEELFTAMRPRLRSQIYKSFNSGNAIVEDIMSDTLFKMYRSLHSYKPEVCYFTTWAYRICSNCIIDYIRKQKKEEVVGIDCSYNGNMPLTHCLSAPVEPDHLERNESVNAIKDAVIECGPKYALMLKRYYYDEKSSKELSKEFYITRETVRWRLLKARSLLKSAVLSKRPDLQISI